MYARLDARVMLTCALLGIAIGPANAGDPCGEGAISRSKVEGNALIMQWTGRIHNEMSKKIEREFEKVRSRINYVQLALSSCGGSSQETARTVSVLRRIKQMHTLDTYVRRGAMCASACVPIFLQGTQRWGALTSVWAFHESQTREFDSVEANGTQLRVSHAATDFMYQNYFEPAGVSKAWLRNVRVRIKNAGWWQTGRDLWESKSGIMTNTIGNFSPQGPDKRFFSPPVVCADFCRG